MRSNEDDSETTEDLGKIESCYIGIGGYQDCQLGFFVTLTSGSSGVSDSRVAWDPERIKCSKNARWTEQDRSGEFAAILRYVSRLMDDAGVSKVSDLVGKPVSIKFRDRGLVSWRILKEVL